MKGRRIGEALKRFRKQRGWTVSDVAVQLSEQYQVEVADKTIYGWESDQAYPRLEIFFFLCELYQIDSLSGVFDTTKNTSEFSITMEERKLIEEYRRHPEFRNAIKKLLL